MDFVLHFVSDALNSTVLIYVVARVFNKIAIYDMMRVLFRSAVGKHRKEYWKSMTLIERYFYWQIPRITSFYSKFVKYLIIDNLVLSASWIVIFIGMILCNVYSADIVVVINGLILFLIVFCDLPPILLFFCLTIYSTGHPEYRFDLYGRGAGRDDILRKRSLRKQAKDGLKLTPDEFSAMKGKRKW